MEHLPPAPACVSTRQRPQSLDEAKALLCWLGAEHYHLGWMTGTGGGLSLRFDDTIIVTPSGQAKELLDPDCLFCCDLDGTPHDGSANPSQSLRLFIAIHQQRQAGAVFHSHALPTMLVTQLETSNVLSIRDIEMIKGITGNVARSGLHMPIIANAANEADLEPDLCHAMANSASACHGVLVRNHGIFSWGDDWLLAKRHAECFDYLCRAVVEQHRLGLR